LTNVDYKKEGLAILIAVIVGLILYFAYRFFGRNLESEKGKS
jgi:predicted negative regulator of RcsB-dependent stress response